MYKTSPDKICRIITFLIGGVFLFIIFFQILILLGAPEEPVTIPALMLVLFSFILVFTWGYAPYGYVIEKKNLNILRKLGTKSIPLSEIILVRAVEKDEMKNTWRSFGNGGVFGYYGKFRNAKFGDMVFYTRRRDILLLLELSNGKKIILGPDELTSFKKSLKEAISKNQ